MIEPLDLSLTYLQRHPMDAARVLESLTPAKCSEFISSVSAHSLTATLNHMAPDYTSACLRLLSLDTKIQIFGLLDTQVAVNVFRYLESGDKYRVLAKLPLHKRLAIQTINKYSQNSVGAWMSTDYLSVREDKTVGEIIELIHSSEMPPDCIFVVGPRREFISIVTISQLIKTSLNAQISSVKNPAHFSLPVRADIQDISRQKGWQYCKTLPVIDFDNRLVGVLTYGDMMMALEKSQLEFSERTAGIGDEVLSLFWVLFNNFIQLLNDLYSIALRKH